MENVLHVMMLFSPIGLALLACISFGLALAARDALGRKRGRREAVERERDVAARTAAKNDEVNARQLERYRRLLDCHIDTLLAAAAEFQDRPVPLPGRVLESFCADGPRWERELAGSLGMSIPELDRLLRSERPFTPGLTRQLEEVTGVPARYWECLWRLHEEHRMEVEKTTVIDLRGAAGGRGTSGCNGGGELVHLPAASVNEVAPKEPVTRQEARSSLEPAGGNARNNARTPGPASVQSPVAPRSAELRRVVPPPRARPAVDSDPHAPARISAVEAHPPAVPHPELADQRKCGTLPSPLKQRMRSPVAASSEQESTPARRAETLTTFPIQREPPATSSAGDWSEVERSLMNVTLPGMGNE